MLLVKENAWVLTPQVPRVQSRGKAQRSTRTFTHAMLQNRKVSAQCVCSFRWAPLLGCLLICPAFLSQPTASSSFCHHTWLTLPSASDVWLTWQSVVCEFISTRLCFLEHWDHVFLVLLTALCNSECSITVIQTDSNTKRDRRKNVFAVGLGSFNG